jgi:hypothetical protein
METYEPLIRLLHQLRDKNVKPKLDVEQRRAKVDATLERLWTVGRLEKHKDQ